MAFVAGWPDSSLVAVAVPDSAQFTVGAGEPGLPGLPAAPGRAWAVPTTVLIASGTASSSAPAPNAIRFPMRGTLSRFTGAPFDRAKVSDSSRQLRTRSGKGNRLPYDYGPENTLIRGRMGRGAAGTRASAGGWRGLRGGLGGAGGVGGLPGCPH